MRPPQPRHPAQAKQRGAALMVMLIIMVMGALTFLVSSLSKPGMQIERDKVTAAALAQAKDEVMGNIMSGVGGQIPGNLLTPDMLSISEIPPYNYDGTANSGCLDASKPGSSPTPGLPLINSGANMRCLGRLPWKAYGMSTSSPSENDPTGVMPWYAISANLVDPLNVIFNPGLLNANPTHPWLTVRDMNGNVLSSRAAIVLMIPGSPLPGQSRPSSPLGGPNQYLDSITVPADCTAPCIPGPYNNYDLDDDFIMGDEHRWIADPNNPTNRIEDTTYHFNDKLIYVTIDELMPLIVKRAAGEARSALNSYNSAKGHFPDAALLGTTGTPVLGNDSGLLPISTCSCASSVSCSCDFGLVEVTFVRNSSNWTSSSGACTYVSKLCTCTAEGSCSRSTGLTNFTCDSSGNCTHNTAGTYTFAPAANHVISSALKGSSCTWFGGTVDCNGSGSFTIMETQLSTSLASWFTDNLWQDYFYYHRSNSSSLQAGTQGNIQALIVGAGAPIVSEPFASKGLAQTRPSGNINDYLDSAENTNGDLLFDATNKPRSSSYNDQVFIVAPWP
jgi:hypothetical protein